MRDLVKGEVLRYLGHRQQEISPALDEQIERAIRECAHLARPAYTARIFPVSVDENGVALEGSGLTLTGKDIAAHLRDAREAAVMAATLGHGVEQAIRRYEYTDLTYALLLDAAATQRIEAVCDQAEAEIVGKAGEKGLVTNFRFSPGYGDLPLDLQPRILEVLDASRAIGLTCSESLILIPRKSVTAIVGMLPPGGGATKKRGCEHCSLRGRCTFRKDGGHCGSTDIVGEAGTDI